MSNGRLAWALVLLVGGLGLGASCRQNRNGRAPDAAGAAPRGAHTDVAAATSPPEITAVSGLDLAALGASEQETFWRVANDELSPCGDPHSLAQCGRDRLPCRSCMPALRFLGARIRDGLGPEALSELLHQRYNPQEVQRIRTEGAPSRGSSMAAVTVVEFSDYQCPHCAHAMPVLRQVEHDFEGRVRVVHMNFPLEGHLRAMAAARAALAAGRQEKFWEMHELLFSNQRALENNDLDRYATQLHLDLNRFHADMDSPAVAAEIAATRREGERLQISGTPAIYINGRVFNLPIEREPLRQWIQEEIDTVAP
jgi:protein-disulfide isomerase